MDAEAASKELSEAVAGNASGQAALERLLAELRHTRELHEDLLHSSKRHLHENRRLAKLVADANGAAGAPAPPAAAPEPPLRFDTASQTDPVLPPPRATPPLPDDPPPPPPEDDDDAPPPPPEEEPPYNPVVRNESISIKTCLSLSQSLCLSVSLVSLVCLSVFSCLSV